MHKKTATRFALLVLLCASICYTAPSHAAADAQLSAQTEQKLPISPEVQATLARIEEIKTGIEKNKRELKLAKEQQQATDNELTAVKAELTTTQARLKRIIDEVTATKKIVQDMIAVEEELMQNQRARQKNPALDTQQDSTDYIHVLYPACDYLEKPTYDCPAGPTLTSQTLMVVLLNNLLTTD